MQENVLLDINGYSNLRQPKSCYDNIFISLANWKNVDYRLLYMDQWRFKFSDVKDSYCEGIWKRGNLASRLYFENELETEDIFSDYVGFEIIYCQNVTYENIRIEICNKNPVAIVGDTFYIPWLKDLFKKVHSEHAFLVVGFNGKGFFCNDTTNYQEIIEKELVTYVDMNLISTGKAAIFQHRDACKSTEYIDEKCIKVTKSMFDSMLQFINYLKKYGIDKNELIPFGEGDGILIRAIRNIGRGRDNFISFLDYLIERDVGLAAIKNKIYLSNKNWILEKHLLNKAYCENNINAYLKYIIELMEGSLVLEKEAYNMLEVKAGEEI